MELLLNLAWVLLALPAYWLWQHGAGVRRVGSLQCLLTLGCVLVLLFPVISASDDLHALRAEMEESTSKRTVRQAGGEKSSAWVIRLQSRPASPMRLTLQEVGLLESSVICLSPRARSGVLHAGRAPPCSLPG